MPRETGDPLNRGGSFVHRQELVSNTEGVDFEAGGVRLRFSNVPLFMSTGDTLLQGVRIRLIECRIEGAITVRIRKKSIVQDEISFNAGQGAEYLFVPEVVRDSNQVIEVQLGRRALGSIPFKVWPQRKWEIHLVHHSHYDIGYTDPQATVLQSQLAFIDDVLELVAETDDWPVESQFRWSIEVNWPLKHWLGSRSKLARDEFARRVREGRIEVNALPFSMHTEAFSFDELARQLDFTQQLRNRLGIEIATAMQTDVPGATVGLSTLLTDAGIKFLAVAHNYAGRSTPHLLDGQELTRPFYWRAPDGERVLVWYTDTLHGSAYMEAMTIGFGEGYDQVLMGLPEYLNALAQRNYPYGGGGDWITGSLAGVEPLRAGYPYDLLHLRVQGAVADNAPPSLLPATIARRWNEQWAYPRLVSSTNLGFYVEAEKRLGDDLETFAGDWTNWWADGIGSSAAMLGKNRTSQAGIRTAQSLHALAQALGDSRNPEITTAVTTAYEEMALFDEHTWGAADPWGTDLDFRASGELQWMRKAGFALAAEERVSILLQSGMEQLSPLATGQGTNSAGEPIAVFNPNSWPRSDLARVFIPRHAWIDANLELIEVDSGRSIPFVVEPQANPRHRPFGVWIVFLAADVPALGYIRYRVERSDASTELAYSPTYGNTLANDHFAVSIDLERGAISSIVDLAHGRELVDDRAPFGFNSYVHDMYTSGSGFNHLSSRIGRAGPWLLGGRATVKYGLITARNSNNVFDRVTWRQSGPGVDWLETTLTMPKGVSTLHIANRLSKQATMAKESVYFAFPFAGDDPAIAFEITGGVHAEGDPVVPGSARHFRAIRHWATIEQRGKPPIAWATKQAALVQVGAIHLPYAPFPSSMAEHQRRPGTIYSWALNNIWDTNFPPQQGGELTFEYVVATGTADSASALGRDTGAVASQPLIGLRAPRNGTPSDLPDRGSFVEVDHPEIEVTHLSTGDDGKLQVHLESHARERVRTRVGFSGITVISVTVASFLGTNRESARIRANGLTVTLNPGELKLIRVDVADR